MNNSGKSKYVEDKDFSSEKSSTNRFTKNGSKSSRPAATNKPSANKTS